MSTALITGASMGLGLEFARLFAADGHDLIITARSADRLEALAAELRAAHGITVDVLPCDLTDAAARKALSAQIGARPIDHLVNNAGFGTTGPFIEADPARELRQIELNVAALVHLTRLVVPGMVARGRGRVLNIASTAGFQPGPYMATYFATKAFVVSFGQALHHELRGTGVRVTTHCPGATATAFAATAGNDKTPLFQRGGVADAAAVAAHAYRAMQAGKRLTVHGLLNAIMAFGVRFSPVGLVLRITAKLNGGGAVRG